MAFKPGESGNPNGRPPGKTTSSLAKSFSADAIGCLAQIANNPSASVAVRFRASEILLNLATGKNPPTPTDSNL